jgi:hypothetical protein
VIWREYQEYAAPILSLISRYIYMCITESNVLRMALLGLLCFISHVSEILSNLYTSKDKLKGNGIGSMLDEC